MLKLFIRPTAANKHRRPAAVSLRDGGSLILPWSSAAKGLARAAEFLSVSSASMAQAANHQCDRALLRGSQTPYPAHGLLCERGERRPDYLLDLPAIQSRLEKQHPQAFYTSSLTSPVLCRKLDKSPNILYNAFSHWRIKSGQGFSQGRDARIGCNHTRRQSSTRNLAIGRWFPRLCRPGERRDVGGNRHLDQ